MAKIAILNDEPEVVTLLARFLTVRGDAFMKRVGDTVRVIEQVIAFKPDLVLVPLYRPPDLIGMTLPNGFADLRGAAMLESVFRSPELDHVPVVVFSFSVRADEIPPHVLEASRPLAFLRFPEGLQELNPVISGFVGPAEGSTDDLERLRASQREFKPPTPPDPDA